MLGISGMNLGMIGLNCVVLNSEQKNTDNRFVGESLSTLMQKFVKTLVNFSRIPAWHHITSQF